jgi:hypothetical protein
MDLNDLGHVGYWVGFITTLAKWKQLRYNELLNLPRCNLNIMN